MNKKIKIRFAVGLALLTIGLSTTAWAQNPHFIQSSVTCSDNGLLFSWKEVGLGDNQSISYEFGAESASVTCTCVTHSGRCPNAANKVTISEPVIRSAEFSSGKNGQITRRNELVEPLACPASAPPTCGNGQELVRSAVSYEGIFLTDTTNDIDASLNVTSCNETFFTCD